ncbi:hypothetical protein FM104_08210 [Microbacterium esteraromaticum]|uniref:DNA polymerase III subunit gamma/tau n=1 Tax=Microbacterium esteraromaticum TaxID=57043 RepID=A0A1R4JMF2_9MICO|nr:hypothetical protein [Microbacterium esteraromaticum]SJN33198.1 hypothetical protein FM104_08210 [Microbacterium esteraromaticum]
MNPDSEDDALNWDGDDALEARRPARRRIDPAPGRPGEVRSADAAHAASSLEPAATSAAPAERAQEPPGLSTVSLVLFGIFGGIYLLYTVGWAVGGLGLQTRVMFLMPGPLYLSALGIAVLAPALWFASVLVLTRHAKDWIRVVGLIVGALLLVPWPFVVAGGGGVL